MNMPSATDSCNDNKRKRRKVRVFSGIGKDFAIDEDDYNAICDVFSNVLSEEIFYFVISYLNFRIREDDWSLKRRLLFVRMTVR